jgi:hypothetical protein
MTMIRGFWVGQEPCRFLVPDGPMSDTSTRPEPGSRCAHTAAVLIPPQDPGIDEAGDASAMPARGNRIARRVTLVPATNRATTPVDCKLILLRSSLTQSNPGVTDMRAIRLSWRVAPQTTPATLAQNLISVPLSPASNFERQKHRVAR